MVRTIVKSAAGHIVASQISADQAAAAIWVAANAGGFPGGYTTSDDSINLSTTALRAQGLLAVQEGQKCLAAIWAINVAKNLSLANTKTCLADADVISTINALSIGHLKEALNIISNSVTAVFSGGEKTTIATAIQASIDAVGY